jgi:hypothetical protein
MPDPFSHIGKTIAVDNFLPTSTGGIRNHPLFVDSRVTKYWHEPSDNPRTSGNEYVKVGDGRVFSRPDHYTPVSPYGWKYEPDTKEPEEV